MVLVVIKRIHSLVYASFLNTKIIFFFISNSVIMSTRHSDNINLPYLDHEARRSPLIRRFADRSSQRDREMRDVCFEKR